jgi:hypothetical protein
MTPTQVNTAMMIIVPALCLISLCATVFVWALCRLAPPERAPGGASGRGFTTPEPAAIASLRK